MLPVAFTGEAQAVETNNHHMALGVAAPMLPDLDELRLEDTTEGDTLFERDLIATLLCSLTVCVRSLSESAAERDFMRLERTAHFAKGGASSLGAARFAHAAAALESGARSEDPHLVQKWLVEVIESYETLKPILERRLTI